MLVKWNTVHRERFIFRFVAIGTCMLVLSTMAGAASAAPPGPSVTVNPTSAGLGAAITLSGSSFPKGAAVTLTWDGSASGMPTASTSANGSFSANVTIPATAPLGNHALGATAGKSSATTTVKVVATSTAATATATPTSTPVSTTATVPSGSHLFGTLLTAQTNATQEYAANVRVAELELGWDNYEPQDGTFSTTYASQAKQKLQAFQAAGLKVVLGIGLQYPPSWVFNYANSRYVNQFGTASGEVNLTFNQTLRQKAAQYIQRVAQDLGPTNFWAIRIGSGGLIESLYPDEWDGTQWHSYWAYDTAAQTGVGLPTGVGSSPFPGWLPGQRQYNGQFFSISQVQQWYNWYLGAMVDGINWQIGTYQAAGFTGYLQLLMPGVGIVPDAYAAAINNYLDGSGDSSGTMGRAAVWNKVLDGLATRQNVVAYVSSMADGSGNNDMCQATDSTVALADPTIDKWSATRWISYNANRYGMLKNGENPGRGATGYGLSMMQTAAQQMQACGFQGMLWAHDADLYDPTSGVTLSNYSTVIAEYP